MLNMRLVNNVFRNGDYQYSSYNGKMLAKGRMLLRSGYSTCRCNGSIRVVDADDITCFNEINLEAGDKVNDEAILKAVKDSPATDLGATDYLVLLIRNGSTEKTRTVVLIDTEAVNESSMAAICDFAIECDCYGYTTTNALFENARDQWERVYV